MRISNTPGLGSMTSKQVANSDQLELSTHRDEMGLELPLQLGTSDGVVIQGYFVQHRGPCRRHAWQAQQEYIDAIMSHATASEAVSRAMHMPPNACLAAACCTAYC
jgi:hypothetical protein